MKASLKSVGQLMKGIDYGMLTTTDGRGTSSSRPMSNNGDVDYDGTSYFFTYANSTKVKQIKKNPKVSLQFVRNGVLKKNVFIHIDGKATLTTDRATLEQHWVPTLKIWFPDGLDTKGITLITVKANAVHYWAGMEEGEYRPKSK